MYTIKCINLIELLVLIAELHVGVLYSQSSITTVYVNEGSDLPEPILCGVSPTTSGYNEALKLNWRKDNLTSILILTDQSNVISQSLNDQQELHVKNVSVNEEGWYVCEYIIPLINEKEMKSVQILVNGA